MLNKKCDVWGRLLEHQWVSMDEHGIKSVAVNARLCTVDVPNRTGSMDATT